jgi:predicted metal-dependent enzyme (double-stranded beta helix superfamily)
MSASPDSIAPLREFVVGMTRLVERCSDEKTLLAEGRGLLAALIADDGWLPDAFAEADPASYRQYLLYCDPLERFSVVSFVWGPGQKTPVHDHTVWGLVGMLRGAELCREYASDGARVVARGVEHTMKPGMIEAVSPTVGDWHVVANALQDRPSISIHVYGANIGAVRRHMVDAATGEIRDFVSGYSCAVLPNLWDRSSSVRAAAT